MPLIRPGAPRTTRQNGTFGLATIARRALPEFEGGFRWQLARQKGKEAAGSSSPAASPSCNHTLAMVFVIQHTQARHQRASQRKLDEILLALPGTNPALVTLEHASDEELHSAGHQHRSDRQAALEGAAASESGDVS